MDDGGSLHEETGARVSRRGLMAALARAGLGGLLVAGTGFLVLRGEGGACARDGVCQGCPAQPSCRLPQARLPRGRESDGG